MQGLLAAVPPAVPSVPVVGPDAAPLGCMCASPCCLLPSSLPPLPPVPALLWLCRLQGGDCCAQQARHCIRGVRDGDAGKHGHGLGAWAGAPLAAALAVGCCWSAWLLARRSCMPMGEAPAGMACMLSCPPVTLHLWPLPPSRCAGHRGADGAAGIQGHAAERHEDRLQQMSGPAERQPAGAGACMPAGLSASASFHLRLAQRCTIPSPLCTCTLSALNAPLGHVSSTAAQSGSRFPVRMQGPRLWRGCQTHTLRYCQLVSSWSASAAPKYAPTHAGSKAACSTRQAACTVLLGRAPQGGSERRR